MLARRRAAAAGKRGTARSRQIAHGTPGAPPTSVAESDKASGDSATEPQALVVSHRFDPGDEGEPYSATLRLTGRRVTSSTGRGRKDTFAHEETIERIVPGSGPLSISSWVYGIEPGEWTVVAELVRPAGHDGWRRPRPEQLDRAAWSWPGRKVSTGPNTPIHTRWALLAPLARIPGVVPGSFTVFGVLAIVVALSLQSAILTGRNVDVTASLAVSLLALASGLIGAKAWSRILHPGEKLIGPGWAVDGFLVVAPIVAVVGLIALDLPIGTYLDATAPGLYFAVAIGRLGCFFTGCCAGRATCSRWGIWSSDRRLGARRIPTQLLESGTGLVLAVVAILLVVNGAAPVPGVVFALSIGAYLLIRQCLLRLRAERREYLWRRNGLVPQRSR